MTPAAGPGMVPRAGALLAGMLTPGGNSGTWQVASGQANAERSRRNPAAIWAAHRSVRVNLQAGAAGGAVSRAAACRTR